MDAVADFLMRLYNRAKMSIMWLFSDWRGQDRRRLQMESEVFNIPFNEFRNFDDDMEYYMNDPDEAFQFANDLAFRAANPDNLLPAGEEGFEDKLEIKEKPN
ncbi:uncharacterized protein LOC26527254 [Drosophila mojavensis]|uniref:Uncharacterized protein n=1 Tax=Drosophila mojavensis TaxID=7230 RepID=A0A0Q9X0C4_DROMO|nr:uncharacterized protein LOC26527254 [Drosophila mojavensis]KRF94234.1 uncharacterized protein Dmoj_GI25613 [Drosophila mojavensis]